MFSTSFPVVSEECLVGTQKKMCWQNQNSIHVANEPIMVQCYYVCGISEKNSRILGSGNYIYLAITFIE